MGWYIILGIISAVFFAGWRIDRRDRANKGRSRRASDMTREAMRYRERYGRKTGR